MKNQEKCCHRTLPLAADDNPLLLQIATAHTLLAVNLLLATQGVPSPAIAINPV
jgi:hypothetical protein